MSQAMEIPRRPGAVQEVVGLWALGFLGIIAAFLLFGGTSIPKLVATVGFLYLPLIPMRWRDEDYRDYGLTLSRWREDVRLFLVMSAIVGPLFFLAFAGFVEVVPHLPQSLARHLTPMVGEGHFRPRLPPRFGEWVVDQLFVVALPEEFFYRGYMQARLRDAWPQGRRVLGGRLGRAFWLTAVLFALGHLAIFQTWRLSVFFPALLFGWMRERTGTILGAALFHAACNLYVRFLEVSFFGGP
ncbi:CPBP family intramembrane metalloprotease [Pyxidicoccus fallax]|uniref:CPBP family intramembrane metalloprotease n=1 Tax=Pyxidicoccus fallax TaxID=394095 RepID=A0A848LB40_9BACT|nr:MXAN_2755 family glutamic-type intramembrane protease [Pyxidicoccus fallax]NMO16280.1 CPBP family intramembrane metalloprotease [Pyxidicoccus fallax]NPC81875.1 CPBP family intramembrane metalloprotease [Pyxidicoccus fallax]